MPPRPQPMTAEQARRNRELQRTRDEKRRKRRESAKQEAARLAAESAERQREAERTMAAAPAVPAVPAVAAHRDPEGFTPTQRFWLEKAKSDERNAAKRAEIAAQIKAALKRADDERSVQTRGGRPKLRPMHLTSDKANALVNALASWHE